MGILGTLGSPFLLRRLLVELRGIRRAQERQADALELLAQVRPRAGGQSFRGFSRERHPGGPDQSGVSYVDPRELELALYHEARLTNFLGRAPTDEEMARAMRGDVE